MSVVGGVVLVGGGFDGALEFLFSIVVSCAFELGFRFVFFRQSCAM